MELECQLIQGEASLVVSISAIVEFAYSNFYNIQQQQHNARDNIYIYIHKLHTSILYTHYIYTYIYMK